MGGNVSSRAAVLQFALSGLFATLVIGLIAVAVSRNAGTHEAIRDAKQVARLAGRGIVEPNIDEGVLDGKPAALRRLDDVIRTRVLRDGVVRVKVWSGAGRIVYSDEPRLIGSRFEMDDHERAALRGGDVEAEVSNLARSENRYERREGKLLEVYMPIHDPQGRPLMFESYQRFSSVSASGRRLWLAFAPALLGGLLLLQLVNLPLAHSLARRLREGQLEREALLRRALDASETERRAIAADLHDGVVQDLVGVSYTLSAHAERVNGHVDDGASAALRDGAARTRHSVRALRTLLVDIYPPSLHRSGLAAALGDLAKTSSARGITTLLRMGDDVAFSESSERLFYRCAQEALRNAHKHSGAETARITVERQGPAVVMEVSDDGSGFDPAVLQRRPEQGHFGLSMLQDLVADAGGQLEVSSAPGSGTTVRVEMPA